MKRMQLFFRLGSWMLIVTALLHLTSLFSQPPAPVKTPTTDAEAELVHLLSTQSHDYWGFERTLMEFLRGFSLSYAVLIFFIGLTNLVLMRVHHGRIKGLRVHALLNTLLCAALFAVSWMYFFTAPLVCFALALLLFGLAFAAGQYQFGWERSAD